jgi:2-polyprenyl-6-methoxyphenol hydroxylase-like FAD-dependent oxidoreductase
MSEHKAKVGRDDRSRVGETAVVVGGSMAGLCAARVLSERFDRVLIIDRDALPDGAEPRRLVPQARHPHLLLAAGARLLEGWFPGILDNLRASGAIDVDICRDFHWYQSGGCQKRPASAARGPAMSRALLERTVRRRVEALANVTIQDRTAVEGLITDASGTRITAVRLEGGETVASDLVVDATGRAARSLGWLHELGYQSPPTSVVEVDTRYVSRVYQRTEEPSRDWKAAAVVGDPASKRLAMLLPMEGERWILAIAGINGESAPADGAGMLAYARTFESPVIADVMASSDPIGEPVTHRFPANQWRHVERLRHFALGWVLLGDAVCSFDPIYGQGMTSAALQAEALGACLERSAAVDRAFARSYFRAASRIVKVPWSIAVGGDFVYEGTAGKKPFGTDLLNRYMDQVVKAGQHDDQVVIRLNEVVALLRSPQTLMAPAFMLRVLCAARRAKAATSVANSTRPPQPDEDDQPRPEPAQPPSAQTMNEWTHPTLASRPHSASTSRAELDRVGVDRAWMPAS